VNFKYSQYSYSSLAFVDENGALVGALLTNNAGNSYYTPSVDDNGNLTLVIKGAAYRRVRLCGYGKGEDLIVTVNEEIT
jgi:hypothetical protein